MARTLFTYQTEEQTSLPLVRYLSPPVVCYFLLIWKTIEAWQKKTIEETESRIEARPDEEPHSLISCSFPASRPNGFFNILLSFEHILVQYWSSFSFFGTLPLLHRSSKLESTTPCLHIGNSSTSAPFHPRMLSPSG